MMRRRPPTVSVRAGLIALALAAAAVYLAFTKEIPFVHHYAIRAEFRDASTLAPGAPVRIAGVNVGKVTEVRSKSAGSRVALVTLRLDGGRPVHRDARAVIRERTQLEGNEFVDLRPGTPSAPEIGDGETIPASRTAAPVQLDQVLSVLDRPTRRALIRTLDQFGKGLQGRGGAAFNRSILHWKPAYKGAAIVNDASLGERPHDLSDYVGSSGKVAEAVDSDPAALRRLITRFDDTAATFASERGALGATIRELPSTLAVGHRTLTDVHALLPHLDRLALDVRPAVRTGVETIETTTPFLQQLRGLVAPSELQGLARDLAPTTSALASVETRLVPLLQQARQASSCADKVVLPWSRETLPDPQFKAAGNIAEEGVKGPLPGLAGESRSGDANGQWFAPILVAGTNVIALGNDKFAATALPVVGVNPQLPQQRPPLRPDVPCETQTKPDLRSESGPPPPQFQVDLTTPEAKARLGKARKPAIDWLRGQLKAQGLDQVLKVADTDLTRSLLERLPVSSPGLLDGMMRRKP
jgi:phospholipid/cholesterol/gamma-HCH transport system substrate-binding protein